MALNMSIIQFTKRTHSWTRHHKIYNVLLNKHRCTYKFSGCHVCHPSTHVVVGWIYMFNVVNVESWPTLQECCLPLPLWKQCVSNIYIIYHPLEICDEEETLCGGSFSCHMNVRFAQAFVDLDCKANFSHTHTLEWSISTSPMFWPIVQSKLAYKLEFWFPCMDSYHKAISSPFTATIVTLSKLDQQVVYTYHKCFWMRGILLPTSGAKASQ